jgi:Tol biopolymer transport system component
MIKGTFLSLVLLILPSIGYSQAKPDPTPYLGQNPPGNIPVIFAPGIVSKGNIHGRLEISPDGREILWNTIDMKTFSTQILSVRFVDGKWSDPQPPSFAGEGDTKAPVFSPDGKKLFFDLNTGGAWAARYVEKTERGWSAPCGDGFSWNSGSSFAKSGRVYFSAGMKAKIWNTGIYGAGYSEAGYSDVEPLDEAINVPGAIDYTPYISSDESFLLFSSNRPLIGDKEDMHIHISFRKGEGTWSTPVKICDIEARFPSISPDGKYIFFCGDDGNIYWVDVKIIEPLKPADQR